MDKIEIEDIRLYAYHGCLAEETEIGSDYRVDLSVWADLGPASVSDNLIDTIDYVILYAIVKEEMNTASKLLEHVCARIISKIFDKLSQVEEVMVTVAKLNPPIGGDTASVKVMLHKKRA